MSFHNQAFWMAKSPECLNDDDVTYDNSSRIEPKRPHQWSMDGPEVDLFPNKKQAVEVPNNLLSGMLNSSISSWGNPSSFQSFTGLLTGRTFDPTGATVNFENRNISSVSADMLSVERKDNGPFGSDSSFGLSMSTTLEDPQLVLNYGGIRKVKVNEVRESENLISVPANHSYGRVVDNMESNPHAYKEDSDSIAMSITYNKRDTNIVSMNDTFGRTDNSLISMGQSYDNGVDNLSVGQTYKEISNTISRDQGFNKVDSNTISIAEACNKGDDNSLSRNHIFNKLEDGTISVGHTYLTGVNKMPFVAHSHNKGESTIISFGGCDDDYTSPSDIFASGYELLMGQVPSPKSKAVNEKGLVNSYSDSLISRGRTSASASEIICKTKEELKMSKKATSNNFPSNVRSLLSTGMLDGVPVKYKAWSREKELRGVIKGSGYLCSCQSCNFSKVINAYEFERHAGVKTKHPNNHIYFENGKTIYGVVQELRTTPQNLLFEVIQTITGSPINQKSFRIWKESFLAAAHELQRICGKDEVKQLL